MSNTNQSDNLKSILPNKWSILEAIVNRARATDTDLPLNFKIKRNELKTYLKEYALFHNIRVNMDDFKHSLLILNDHIIELDHNPGTADYKTRYLGFGEFGKVKKGVDSQGNRYAVKTARKRNDPDAESEKLIMKKIGLLVGTVNRRTESCKPWLDGSPILEKETTVMKLLEGETLSNFFDDKHPSYRTFTDLEAKLIALGIIRAIAKLHQQGIAHRDIHAGNFLLNIQHFPQNLTQDNFEAYLNGELEGCDFNQLINVTDFGLACEIPVDGSETNIPLTAIVKTHTTAPECLAFNRYSSDLETYSIVHFIKFQLGLSLMHFEPMFPSNIEQFKGTYEKLISKAAQVKKELDQCLDLQTRDKLIKQLEAQAKFLAHNKIQFQQLIASQPLTRFSIDELLQIIKSNIETTFRGGIYQSGQYVSNAKPITVGYNTLGGSGKSSYLQEENYDLPTDSEKNQIVPTDLDRTQLTSSGDMPFL